MKKIDELAVSASDEQNGYVKTGLRIKKDLLKQVDEIANDKSINRNALFCLAISEYVNSQKEIKKLQSQENMQEIVKALLIGKTQEK